MKKLLNIIKKTILLFIVGFCISQASGWTSVQAFSDNFDSYTTGSINGQGSWTSDGYSQVFSGQAYSNPNSLQTHATFNSSSHSTTYTGGDYSYSFRFLVSTGENVSFRISQSGGGTRNPVVIENVSNVVSIKNGVADTFYTGVTKDLWHKIDVNYNGTTHIYSVSLDGSSFINSTYVHTFTSGSNTVDLVRNAYSGTNLLIDDYSDSNSLISPLSLNTITVTNPTSSPSTLASPFSFNFSGSAFSSSSPVVFDKFGCDLVNFNTMEVIHCTPDILVSGSSISFNHTITLVDNTAYSIVGYLYNSADSSIPRYSSSVYYLSTGDGGGITPGTIRPQSCTNYTGLASGICNFVVWLFVPSSDSLSKWNSITLYNSFPFSYLKDIGVAYSELFSNSGSMSYTLTIPIWGHELTLISPAMISAIPFASTVKTLLGYLIWVIGGFTIYKIILHKTHS